MFNNWFGKDDTTDLRLSGSEKNGNGNGRSQEPNEQLKRLLDPRQAAAEWPDRANRKPVTSPSPPAFEQIYQTAAVKPPKLAYGIQKVAEMGNEESYLDKVNQFEAAQSEQTRLHQTELEKITSRFEARIEASRDEVERRDKEFRDWQKIKQQELQRLTDAAALCVPHETEEEEESGSKVLAIAQRAGGACR